MGSDYHHGDLKNTLVRSARAQIASGGAAALNLRALAREVGVTHPAVYRHFASKEVLLEAVAQEGFNELADGLHESVARGEGGLEPTLHSPRGCVYRVCIGESRVDPRHVRAHSG